VYVGDIEPLNLIVTAVASGASAALKDSAGEAIKGAYQALKRLVRRRLDGRGVAETALDEYEANGELCEQALRQELTLADAGSDQEIVQAARALLGLLDLHRVQEAGKYSVKIHGPVQGTVIGDHAQVTQRFSPSPIQP
jgi:hypothetical protein